MWRMWCNINKINARNIWNTSSRKISAKYIEISEEVSNALKQHDPVVALESTIITHGMPYPNNLQCAMEVEAIVRERVSCIELLQ